MQGAASAMAALALARRTLAHPGATADFSPLGGPQRFDYAWLKGRARALAAQPHQPDLEPLPPSVTKLGWDEYQSIRFRPQRALWHERGLRFRLQFFHLGLYFKQRVRMYELNAGMAQEIAYDPQMFDYGSSGLDHESLPRDLGWAGFRVHGQPDFARDVAAFLGASYFRAVGEEKQYGLSARGLAVDCGLDRPEEFPIFTHFWLERPSAGSNTLTVFALLDSPSVTGAYRFAITPGVLLLMDVDAALYPRNAIERVGTAPCPSMFQCGENDRRMAYDMRPEIHDSDGLALHTGTGEWIWRPLVNPEQRRLSAHEDENPRGFGLLQRDRNFESYQDDGVFYDKRPCLWVEPKGGWGAGSVQLLELPTVDETFDNIVAFWTPKQALAPQQEHLFGYRLYWGARPPVLPEGARVVATRTGLGGVVGRKREFYSYRFAVDFAGPALSSLPHGSKLEPVITASRGQVLLPSLRPLRSIGGYRATFDLRPPDDEVAAIDLRLFLRHAGTALSETWAYQWSPPPPAQRIVY